MRAMSNDRPIVRCVGLEKTYRGPASDVSVLRGVDLELRSHEATAILGPSGSGKSTLVHLLAGLDRPDGGEIWWHDVPVHELGPSRVAELRRDMVGLVFQNHYLLDELDALDNVALPGRIGGHVDRERAQHLLDSVGLGSRMHHRPRQLSGGERQRVAVARALYPRPRLVIADEPTGSLDRENARTVYELLLRLVSAEGGAALIVTHDHELVRDVPERWTLRGGRLHAAVP